MITLLRSLLILTLLVRGPQDPDDAARAARLDSAMGVCGLSYQKSTSGKSYTVTFTHDGNRQQTVSIAPGRPGGLVTHSIYTTVWIDQNSPPDEATMRKVLANAKKLGAYYLFKDTKGTWALRFGTQFDATDLAETPKAGDATVRVLRELIEFVDEVGEQTDRELNGERDIR